MSSTAASLSNPNCKNESYPNLCPNEWYYWDDKKNGWLIDELIQVKCYFGELYIQNVSI